MFSEMEGKRRKRKKRWGIFFLLILLALVGLRLALPHIVQEYVNNKLDEIPEYDGHIGDVDIHLIRGAYAIDKVDIMKMTGNVELPFFAADRVDLSMQWRELFHGALAGEIDVQRGVLHFVKAESEQNSQTSVDESWLQVVQDLFPFKINRFAIEEGAVWFHDVGTDPKVDIYLTNMTAVCTNIYNTRKFKNELPADFRAQGTTIGGGHMEVHVKLDPLSYDPLFDLELTIEETDLVDLNSFLEAYGNFHVHSGTFEVFCEVAAANGAFEGYVKPFFLDLNVLDVEEDARNPLNLIWQAIVAGAVQIFKNHPEDQLATRIPVSGTFENTQVDVWTTILNILRNAFVEAFSTQIDESIQLFDGPQPGKEISSESGSK